VRLERSDSDYLIPILSKGSELPSVVLYDERNPLLVASLLA